MAPATVSARTSREVAVEVLLRVETDRAFSGTLLRRTLDRADLSARDESLATELTLGTLRHRAEIDWTLSRVTHTPLDELPPRIRAILRSGAYQLMFLDRIPPAAACSQAVELAKKFGHAGTARLVNAVLRRIAATPVAIPEDEATAGGIALRHSHPEWLVRRWVTRFGPSGALALCRANNATPPSAVRLNILRGTPAAIVDALAGMGVRTAPSALLPEGARIVAAAPPARSLAYTGGWVSWQDEGAMLVSRLVAPRPGETLVDACAGSGGKTMHLATLMENQGRVIACDIVQAKLDAIGRHAARLGVTIVEPYLLDAARLRDVVPSGADRVLVDAPCSGLGVLRRRPEIKWRIEPAQLPLFAGRQLAILTSAAEVVRPEGLLVFAVCTIEPDEGPAVASAFLHAHPEFQPAPITGWPPGNGGAPGPAPLPGLSSLARAPRSSRQSDRSQSASGDADGTAFLVPHLHDTDGFFVAAFRRAR